MAERITIPGKGLETYLSSTSRSPLPLGFGAAGLPEVMGFVRSTISVMLRGNKKHETE